MLNNSYGNGKMKGLATGSLLYNTVLLVPCSSLHAHTYDTRILSVLLSPQTRPKHMLLCPCHKHLVDEQTMHATLSPHRCVVMMFVSIRARTRCWRVPLEQARHCACFVQLWLGGSP